MVRVMVRVRTSGIPEPADSGDSNMVGTPAIITSVHEYSQGLGSGSDSGKGRVKDRFKGRVVRVRVRVWVRVRASEG